jgi:hypothetical protein
VLTTNENPSVRGVDADLRAAGRKGVNAWRFVKLAGQARQDR